MFKYYWSLCCANFLIGAECREITQLHGQFHSLFIRGSRIADIPCYCTICGNITTILFWINWVSPFFISSDALGVCVHSLLQCLCQLCYFSGIYHSIFFKISLFFLLSFPLLELVPVSESIDNSFPQLLMCPCTLVFQEVFFSSISASFARLIHRLCNNCGCSTYQVVCYVKFIFFYQSFNYSIYFNLKLYQFAVFLHFLQPFPFINL